jgi:hypothetical protein
MTNVLVTLRSFELGDISVDGDAELEKVVIGTEVKVTAQVEVAELTGAIWPACVSTASAASVSGSPGLTRLRSDAERAQRQQGKCKKHVFMKIST